MVMITGSPAGGDEFRPSAGGELFRLHEEMRERLAAEHQAIEAARANPEDYAQVLVGEVTRQEDIADAVIDVMARVGIDHSRTKTLANRYETLATKQGSGDKSIDRHSVSWSHRRPKIPFVAPGIPRKQAKVRVDSTQIFYSKPIPLGEVAADDPDGRTHSFLELFVEEGIRPSKRSLLRRVARGRAAAVNGSTRFDTTGDVYSIGFRVWSADEGNTPDMREDEESGRAGLLTPRDLAVVDQAEEALGRLRRHPDDASARSAIEGLATLQIDEDAVDTFDTLAEILERVGVDLSDTEPTDEAEEIERPPKERLRRLRKLGRFITRRSETEPDIDAPDLPEGEPDEVEDAEDLDDDPWRPAPEDLDDEPWRPLRPVPEDLDDDPWRPEVPEPETGERLRARRMGAFIIRNGVALPLDSPELRAPRERDES